MSVISTWDPIYWGTKKPQLKTVCDQLQIPYQLAAKVGDLPTDVVGAGYNEFGLMLGVRSIVKPEIMKLAAEPYQDKTTYLPIDNVSELSHHLFPATTSWLASSENPSHF
jgi:hypothetical protein